MSAAASMAAAAGVLAAAIASAAAEQMRAGIHAALAEAIERSLAESEDEPAIQARQLGMRAALRIVEAAEPQATLTVYRAAHESIPLGTYTSRQAARAHCEAYVRLEQPTAVLTWVLDGDDDDAVEDLFATTRPDEPDVTGYTVTQLEVAAIFDPEADL